MVLGFSKDFVIFIFISIVVGFATENPKAGLSVLGAYIVVKIIWRFLR